MSHVARPRGSHHILHYRYLVSSVLATSWPAHPGSMLVDISPSVFLPIL